MGEAIFAKYSKSSGGSLTVPPELVISNTTKSALGLDGNATLDDCLKMVALKEPNSATIQVVLKDIDESPIANSNIRMITPAGTNLVYRTDNSGTCVFRTTDGQATIVDEGPNYIDIVKPSNTIVDCPVGTVKSIVMKKYKRYSNTQNISITAETAATNHQYVFSNHAKSCSSVELHGGYGAPGAAYVKLRKNIVFLFGWYHGIESKGAVSPEFLNFYKNAAITSNLTANSNTGYGYNKNGNFYDYLIPSVVQYINQTSSRNTNLGCINNINAMPGGNGERGEIKILDRNFSLTSYSFYLNSAISPSNYYSKMHNISNDAKHQIFNFANYITALRTTYNTVNSSWTEANYLNGVIINNVNIALCPLGEVEYDIYYNSASPTASTGATISTTCGGLVANGGRGGYHRFNEENITEYPNSTPTKTAKLNLSFNFANCPRYNGNNICVRFNNNLYNIACKNILNRVEWDYTYSGPWVNRGRIIFKNFQYK